MSYKLSICIPTYNRCVHLKRTLSCILPQLLEDNVQVVISDNASTDGTEILMNNVLKKTDNILYHRHENNLGFANNLICAMDMAEGDYLWMLGDDDFLKLNAIATVLETIEMNKPDLIITDFDYFVDETGHQRFHIIGVTNSDAFLRDQKKIIDKVNIWLSLIGINIVRSSVYREAKRKPNLLASNYAGLHITLTGFGSERSVIYINQSIINSRRSTLEDVRWKDWQLFAFDFASIVDVAVDRNAIGRIDGRMLKSRMLSGMCQKLLLHYCESRHLPLWEVIIDRRWVKYHRASFWFWCITLPTCLLPPFVPVYFTKAYRACKAIVRKCLHYDP